MAEAFQSLYRRYRPQRFSELRGQPHVVMALSHAVRNERVAHAYLFSGPRGTGKTSTARILAKALNCQAPQDGEPCGVCASCAEIASGVSLDVHELDAASNSGVDAMRDLVARASLATPGKWKVYIVDEVHMLSTAAANALLKTLEEPPSHVVFVLATTDPQKVLATIKSRTQHFDFHLFDPGLLATLLTEISADAALELPPDGIEAAVRRGHGSARDALSALDQIVAAGAVGDESRLVRDLIEALAEADTGKALMAVAQAAVEGLDAPRLAAELIDGLRGVFLGAVAPGSSGALFGPDGRPALSPARSVRALEVIGSAVVEMREALDARTCFEVALVRMTHPEVDDTPAALVERVERLERRVADLASAPPAPGRRSPSVPAGPLEAAPSVAEAGGSPALGAYRRPAASPGGPPAASGSGAPSAATAPAASEPSPSGPSPTRDDLAAAWGDHILSSLRAKPRAVFAAGRFVASEAGVALFALPSSVQVSYAEPLIPEVAAVLSNYFKCPVGLRLTTDAATADSRPAPGTGSPGGSSPGGAQAGSPVGASLQSRSADEEYEDVADLEPGEAAGNHDPVSWAASRLLEAFPGAEEVP
ncbi:MAG: DNA polymerase III subunit gamma/tau [Acidimicrobiales bacterium]